MIKPKPNSYLLMFFGACRTIKNFTSNIFPALYLILVILSVGVLSCNKNDDIFHDDEVDERCLVSFLSINWKQKCADDYFDGESYISINYNESGNIINWSWLNSAGEVIEEVIFLYHEDGNLLKIEWNKPLGKYYYYFDWENANKLIRQRGFSREFAKNIYIEEEITFNSSGQITRVDGYLVNGQDRNLSWYSNYYWEGGNLIKISEYLPNTTQKTSIIGNYERRMPVFQKKETVNYAEKINQVINNDDKGFVKCFSLEFEYDSGRNVLSVHDALRLWDLSAPLFQSENNLILLTETGLCYDDVRTSKKHYSWKYNQYNCPANGNMKTVDDNKCDWTEKIEFSYEFGEQNESNDIKNHY